MKNDYSSYAQIIHILGNGDFRCGYELLESLAKRLDYARGKHKWGENLEIDTPAKAYNALHGENREWLAAMNAESPERQKDEALDCLAVAVRIYNQEFLQK